MKELKNSLNTRENSFSLDSTSINSNSKRQIPFFITRKKLRIRSQSMQNSDLSFLHKSQNIVNQLKIGPVYEDEEEYLEEKKPRIKRCSMLLDKKEDSLFKVKGRRTNESRPKSFDIKLPGVKEEDETYQGRQKRQMRKFKYFAQIDKLEQIENQQILIDSTKDFICCSSQQPIKEEKDEEENYEDNISNISKSSHSSFLYNFVISDVLDQIKSQKNNKISEIIQEADRAEEEDDEDECSSQVVKDLKKKRNNFKQYLRNVTKSDLVCLDLIPENQENKDKQFNISEQIEEDTSSQLIN